MDSRLVKMWQQLDRSKGIPREISRSPVSARSQADIAGRLETNKMAIHRYYSGVKEPSLHMYGRLWGAVMGFAHVDWGTWAATVARSLGHGLSIDDPLSAFPDDDAYVRASRLGIGEMMKDAGIPAAELMAQSMEMIP
jgi:hypothetical protein